ncbi:hypothetical protein IQB76_19150 [Leptospira borgpetersenii serovar Hardjo-bovis]|uniref:hypothetical protein n=1 Tax=Leptospira borgpetersenii TaxID=174 RepID=UPI00187E4C62|nr:hypothetical protein [Leptospira borgpetersenii]MBE8398211.1 hypothetical protein [Leptospira borgpetersenii serovar Hardjo-bovis]
MNGDIYYFGGGKRGFQTSFLKGGAERGKMQTSEQSFTVFFKKILKKKHLLKLFRRVFFFMVCLKKRLERFTVIVCLNNSNF